MTDNFEDSGSDADVESEEESVCHNDTREGEGQTTRMGEIMLRILKEDATILSKAKRTKTRRAPSSEAHIEVQHDPSIEQSERPVREEMPGQLWDPDTERRLKQIATRGAVKLFNAVNKQQKEVELKLGGSSTEAKRARVVKSVNKGSFLDMLRQSEVKTVSRDKRHEKKAKDQPAWSVLRDDFVMAAKMRDWDKDNSDSMHSNEKKT